MHTQTAKPHYFYGIQKIAFHAYLETCRNFEVIAIEVD